MAQLLDHARQKGREAFEHDICLQRCEKAVRERSLRPIDRRARSFTECEHYVSGGWGFSPLKNQELFSQDLILYFVIVGIVLSFLKPKIKEYFQN